MSAHVDDRIVLPLSAVREAARLTCRIACQGGIHMRPCLVPYVEQRDRLIKAQPPVDGVSGDCMDPIKHGACSGCACSCHRPTGGVFHGPSSPRPLHSTPPR